MGTPYVISHCYPGDDEDGPVIYLNSKNREYPEFSIHGDNQVLLRVDCEDSKHSDEPYFVSIRYIEMPDIRTSFSWIKNHWYTAWRAKNDGTRSIKEKSYGKNYMFEYIPSEDSKENTDKYLKVPTKKRRL